MAELSTLPTGKGRDLEASTTPTAPTQPPGLAQATATDPETQTRKNTTKNTMAQQRGLDFTPIISHYLFLVTFVLAGVRTLTSPRWRESTRAEYEANYPFDRLDGLRRSLGKRRSRRA
jgi:hypothetical protein